MILQDTPADHRVCFDFELDFTNGGGLSGHGFRLDIDGDDISDQALAEYIIRDLRLLMVGEVRILNRTIIREPHKRAPVIERQSAEPRLRRYYDLSHTIRDGLVTLKGFPAAAICDFMSREESRKHYAPGTEFHIGRIDMIANTGTYLDTPFHRFADGADLADLELAAIVDLPGVLVRVSGQSERAITRSTVLGVLSGVDVRGCAVLVHTGWSRNWDSDAYFDGHPFLTEDAARLLADAGAALVGIDSLNIDDTSDPARPVHTTLLGSGIPVVEHLTGLDPLPAGGFRFSAVPPKVRGMGTFPVRAYATVEM
jgi:arylformamidase